MNCRGIAQYSMKPIDAHRLPDSSEVNTDICIIGAGVAGITIASEFVGRSQEICLVESGKFLPDEDVQALYDIENVGYPVRENFMSRARYFGGSSNLWPGRCMRLNEADLQKKDWVANSGWPITYSELNRYYQKAVKILRLPPFDAFDLLYWENILSAQEKAFFQNGLFKPKIAIWAKRPLRFGKAFYSKIKHSKNVTVYLNLNATEIRLSDSGSSVDGVMAACLNGKKISIKAQTYILACGGLENARLLLVSRNQCRHGVGNRFDLVGRYYMDHPRVVCGHVHLHQAFNLRRLLGIPFSKGKIQVGIGLSEDIQKREELLNNYLSLETNYAELTQESYHSLVKFAKRFLRKGYAGKRLDFFASKTADIPDLIYLLAPREIMPHFFYRCSAVLPKKKKNLIVVNYCEQEPDPESRVMLSTQRDKLSMNLLTLNWRIGKKEKISLMRLQEMLAEFLQKHKIGFLDTASLDGDNLQFSDASHHIGTTRMSDDPKRGVTDKNCRIFGLNNLFIAGSSVFPTSGHANPTLTIVALSLRLAAFLKSTT